MGVVRGIGLVRAVEFVCDKKNKQPFRGEMNFSSRVACAAAKRGLLVYPMQGCVNGVSGDHILIAPPAIITDEEISWSVQQLRETIQEVAAEVTS